MTETYYQSKRRAAQYIVDKIRYLDQNPKQALQINLMVIDFQVKFGFSDLTLFRMLEPYLKTNKYIIDGELLCAKP